MPWLKFLAPIFVLAAGLLQFFLENKWHDKRTNIHNKLKLVTLFVMVIATLITIMIVIQDDKKAVTLNNQIIEFKAQADTIAKAAEYRNTLLITRIDSLETSLSPFIKLASIQFPDINTELALAKLANEIESQRNTITALKEYSYVAQLDIKCKMGLATPPLIETTPISQLLEGTINEVNGKASFSCDPVSIEKYYTVISKYPKFPSSYYMLAYCFKLKNDNSWKEYTAKALEIFKKTTLIDHHHQNHDEALKDLNDNFRF